MPDNTDEWVQVGAAIRQRFTQLRLSSAELTRRSGVSFKTLQRYMEGAPIVRADKARELCRALGWTPDSIDRLLAGKDPVEVRLRPDDPPDALPLRERLAEVEDDIDSIEPQVAQLLFYEERDRDLFSIRLDELRTERDRLTMQLRRLRGDPEVPPVKTFELEPHEVMISVVLADGSSVEVPATATRDDGEPWPGRDAAEAEAGVSVMFKLEDLLAAVESAVGAKPGAELRDRLARLSLVLDHQSPASNETAERAARAAPEQFATAAASEQEESGRRHRGGRQAPRPHPPAAED